MKAISFLTALAFCASAWGAGPGCTAADQDLIFGAKWMAAERNWDGVLNELSKVSEACSSAREVQKMGAYAEVGLCGFAPMRFLANKTMLRYPSLMSPDLKNGPVKPEACESAVKRLEALPRRTVEESRLLGAASIGLLSTTLMQRLDKDGDGMADGDLDLCDEDQVSLQTIGAIFRAQTVFLRNAAKLTDRRDLATLVADVKEQCSSSRVCIAPVGDLSIQEIKVARSLLRTLLDLPVVGNCVR